jgi:fucose 4-O-acetylase-like acetyltransferase
MVGVSVGAAGPVMANALENQAWFAPVSWVVQIMPLFFIVGGFASITQWRSLRARGSAPAAYVRGRIDRLLRPAIFLVAAVGEALLAMTVLGVPAEIVATASYRIGQPLWFLAVYILCSALVPAMTRAHETARVATAVGLLAAVVTVDLARMTSGVEAVGFLNLFFVWLLVQQLGFWLADGLVDAMSRRVRAGISVAALAVLTVLTSGAYSPDMLVNLNPPTVCLVVLGVAQLMAFSLLRPQIAALAARPGISRIVDAIGQRSITVYLWHMPVLIALSALLLVANATTGLALPEPLSAEWWSTRPLWLVAVGLLVIPAVLLLARFERGRTATAPAMATTMPADSRWVALDTVLGAAGVATALVAGFTVLPAVISLVLLGGALVGSGRLVGTAISFWRMTQTALARDAESWRTF